MTEPQTPEFGTDAPSVSDPTDGQGSSVRKVIAGVLWEHQDGPADNGGRFCICGKWTGSWTGEDFALHQAAEVVAALGLREEWLIKDGWYPLDESAVPHVPTNNLERRYVTERRPADGD